MCAALEQKLYRILTLLVVTYKLLLKTLNRSCAFSGLGIIVYKAAGMP